MLPGSPVSPTSTAAPHLRVSTAQASRSTSSARSASTCRGLPNSSGRSPRPCPPRSLATWCSLVRRPTTWASTRETARCGTPRTPVRPSAFAPSTPVRPTVGSDRLLESLHRRLAIDAAEEQVSINQLVIRRRMAAGRSGPRRMSYSIAQPPISLRLREVRDEGAAGSSPVTATSFISGHGRRLASSTGSTPSSWSNASTRARISSRIGRTDSMPWPAGSSSFQSS